MADAIKIIAENRKARHDYFILETWECGLVLQGTEVKSLRLGQANFKDAFAQVKQGELWLNGLHISPYEKGNRFNHEAERPRKLLAHKREIRKMQQRVQLEGRTLVPLKLYFTKGKVKVELAEAKGKKLYDKRDDQSRREVERRIEQTMKGHFGGDY